MRWRPLAGPGLATLLMLAALLGLGTWQVRRMHWKHALLARIAHAEAQPAVPLAPGLSPFAKVRVEGSFVPECALYGAELRDTPAGPALGAQLVQPLARPGDRPVLVERGWVPRDGAARFCAAGPAVVEAYLHTIDRPGWFTPRNEPAQRQFYTLDPAAIGGALGVPDTAPFVLVALGAAESGPPLPASHLPQPPDNHLDYALTWYGLAVVLAAIFILWARKQARA